MQVERLFKEYDLLLPSPFEGGYLILALYGKVKSEEYDYAFTTIEIRNTLREIAERCNQPVAQSERIIQNLGHYYLRNYPGEPGKFYLTDFACSVVELMIQKLDNPYKNYPLKENFDKHFVLEPVEISKIEDLDSRFGRMFISGPKKIINDHLESLEDELTSAYNELNRILQIEEENVMAMVNQFASVFATFGDRAEDITNAIESKDKFLRSLTKVVDFFYAKVANEGNRISIEKIEMLKKDWNIAQEIFRDLEEFFNNVDFKIRNIQKRILNASDKLSELQESFSVRSHFRKEINRLLQTALDCASYSLDGMHFKNNFPIKYIPQSRNRFFFPERYDFKVKKVNVLIEPETDLEYENEERKLIEAETNRQHIINKWLKLAMSAIEEGPLALNILFDSILEEENFTIAYSVGIELTQFVSTNKKYSLIVEQQLTALKNYDLHLWKTEMRK